MSEQTEPPKIPREPLTPIQVENAILDTTDLIHRGVAWHNKKYEEMLAAETDYKHAHARAFLAHQGPGTEKKPAADFATYNEREAWDTARVAEKYAEKKLEACRAELFAWQNLNNSVGSAYNAERGHGR